MLFLLTAACYLCHPEHTLWLRHSTSVPSGLYMICLLTSLAMFYHRLPCSSHSYYSGLFLLQEHTIHVLAPGPLNLLFSWLETLPPCVIPVHSVTFSGSSIASLSHLDSLYPMSYFFSAFISNWQILWLYIVCVFLPFHNTSS